MVGRWSWTARTRSPFPPFSVLRRSFQPLGLTKRLQPQPDSRGCVASQSAVNISTELHVDIESVLQFQTLPIVTAWAYNVFVNIMFAEFVGRLVHIFCF